MSAEDGLLMQLHAGSSRNHNETVYRRFGLDAGADIPAAADWTRGLRALLNEFGNDPRFRLIAFALDESAYFRELAPTAGHYPALLLGGPWWFFDSPHGMRRYLNSVMETAGLYNTAGFNDDTRAFASIPAPRRLAQGHLRLARGRGRHRRGGRGRRPRHGAPVRPRSRQESLRPRAGSDRESVRGR